MDAQHLRSVPHDDAVWKLEQRGQGERVELWWRWPDGGVATTFVMPAEDDQLHRCLAHDRRASHRLLRLTVVLPHVLVLPAAQGAGSAVPTAQTDGPVVGTTGVGMAAVLPQPLAVLTPVAGSPGHVGDMERFFKIGD